ncbi:MAG TPA: MMPL family transporter [Candidatus Thermoplasmatota archaeon]|nr:MMPL family transporter [Candidatus Thermoplasmatota archaeon]
MGQPKPVWLVALALAAFGALLGHVGGSLAGELTQTGFTADWYVQGPSPVVPASKAVPLAGTFAVFLAGLLAPVGVLLALSGRDIPKGARGGSTATDAYVLRVTLGAVALLGAAAVLATAASVPFPASAHIAHLAWLAASIGALAGAAPALLAARAARLGRLHRAESNLIGRAAAAASRSPLVVLAVFALLTVGAAGGLAKVHTDVDVADVLPRGDHNSTAAHNLTDKFKSAFTQQVTLQFTVPGEEAWARDNAKLPNRRTNPQHANISDEVYVRALDEFLEFVRAQPGTPYTGSVAIPDFYRIINWTIAGGIRAPDASYALPGTDAYGELQYASVDRGVWAAIPGTVTAVMSPDRKTSAVLLIPSPDTPLTSKELGREAIRLRDAYVDWAESDPKAYKVFTGDNPPLVTADLVVSAAHASDLTSKDFAFLMPIVGAFIVGSLFFAFRSVKLILVAFAALVLAVAWTFGVMGHMGIALNTLNLTIVPLILGVGIDYSIHMVNEFQLNRARGSSPSEAWAKAGSHGALALFVATLTTISGLIVMIASPSLLIAQLGVLASIAMLSMYLLSVLFIPAAVTILNPRVRERSYKPAATMGAIAVGVSRARILVVIVLLGVLAGAYASSQRLGTENFGDPPRNWLPDDPFRKEHEEGLRRFYNVDTPEEKANVLVFEGDITDPRSHMYMEAIEASLREEERVVTQTLRTLPFLMRTYLTVREGVPGAAQFLLLENLGKRPNAPVDRPYPATREEVDALLDEIQTTPLFEFANLFYNHPKKDTAIMVFSLRAATFEDASEAWTQVWRAVDENERLRPPGMKVALAGNTATNYLFVAKEVPWLTYMSVAVNITVVIIVLLVARNLRTAATVGVANFATALVWLGALPFLGIGMAITLALPLIFIFAMGSDYSLHLAMAAQKGDDTEEVFQTTGKAILFSFVTTAGSFAIFTQMSDLAVRKTMVGTTVAIFLIFLLTVLIVPTFFPARRAARPRRVEVKAPPAPPVVEAAAPTPFSAPAEPAPAVGGEEPASRPRVPRRLSTGVVKDED